MDTRTHKRVTILSMTSSKQRSTGSSADLIGCIYPLLITNIITIITIIITIILRKNYSFVYHMYNIDSKSGQLNKGFYYLTNDVV